MNTYDDEMLRALTNGIEEILYVMAAQDNARSADLLEDLCRRLHLAAQRDRAKTRKPAPKRASTKLH